MRKTISLLMATLLSVTLLFAQSRVITGKVTDEKGDPIPYATVKVKGGTRGVSADANGEFRIEVPAGTVLVVGSSGAGEQEITVTAGQSSYTVKLATTSANLTEVVVSALGIKRSVKSTPYTTQQISGERLTQTREVDLTSALAGKVAGLQVLGQSGASLGASGSVRLRGVAGIADGTAIYVVNGTIVENVSDINMDDVANVSILKGPNATALYGQRAQGGVIIITLKNGAKNKPLAVDFNSTTIFEKINRLPEYQNLYGGGNNSNPNDAWAEDAFVWKAGMPEEWKALQGYRRQQYYDDASWGPRLDGGDYIPWYSWYGGHADSYKPAKFVAQPNNVRDFYQTGINANNNINISKGGKNWDGRFGYTNLSRKGVIPNSTQMKHYFSTQDNFTINKHFTVSTSVGVTFEDFKGDFYDEYGGNTIGSFSQWFHRNIDMNKMRELRGLKGPTGTFASWNIDDAAGMSPTAIAQPAFWFNPYTWLDNLSNKTHRFRVIGDLALTYKLNNDFKITGTYRMNYRTTRTEVQIPYVLEASSGTYGITADETGASPLYNKFRHDNTKYVEQNFELIAQYNKKIRNFTFEGIAGGNVLDVRRNDSARSTAGGLVVPDLFQISNSKSTPVLGGAKSYRQVRSAFLRGTIGFKDYLFLDFSGRVDASSTLPVAKNTYFYPSVGTSFVFSDFIKNTALSFGKFRFSVAQIGSDPLAPYGTQFNYTVGNIPYGNNPLSAVPNVFVDPNLEIPKNTSYEAGVDLRFFKNRVGLNATVYTETRVNDIVTTDVSTASGFSSGVINAGKVRRKGIEIELNLKPVVSRNFSWDFTFNWAINRSNVLRVSPTTDQYTIYSNYVGQPLALAIQNMQWGQLRATGIKRINGLPVLNLDGTYQSQENVDFGSVLPNYTGGVFNSFRYKNFVLSASVDFQQGGKYFSFSDFNGKYSGLNRETATTNDKGVNIREPLADGGGVHVYGVKENGKPYDTYVNAYDYYRQFNTTNIWDYSIFDASFIKLREVSLGYTVPVKKLGIGNTVKGAFISVVARNIWMWSSNPNIDPSELASTYAENGQLPGTKSLGVNLKLNF